ncbi:MAG: hypothetical protein A2Y17_12875 [Clostridiales bacterium GWF2_38_85]|nr:MAG: hypothetical protein A2Y17_12875 [Clostridiales bacterium GWF2_38_85]HBL84153.1 hypothetical protein [Clostridiales bacterium]
MSITYREATIADIEMLVKLRLEYLTADRGTLSEKEIIEISNQLYSYFQESIEVSFVAIFAEENSSVVSTAYLAISTKPANPSFITGKNGTILNVYTKPEFRNQGIATHVLTLLIEKAKNYNISKLELSATEMGKPLYQKLGFIDKHSKYTDMQLQIL